MLDLMQLQNADFEKQKKMLMRHARKRDKLGSKNASDLYIETFSTLLGRTDSPRWIGIAQTNEQRIWALRAGRDREMSTKRERRIWALEMSASLLQSDMDCFLIDEYDEEEQQKRRDAIRELADELKAKAQKMGSR